VENDAGLARYLARFHERRALYLQQPRSLEEPDVYEFPRGRRLLVVSGNIVRQQVDALVSSDDEFLSMRGGVSRAICDAAGAQIMEEQTRRYGRVRPGRAVVTPAGRLPARFVFHGVTLAFRDDQPLRPSRDLIIEILHSCIYHADSLHVESLALPLLGTGTAQFSPEVCLDTTFQFLARTLLRGLTSVREARIVLFA
jgi:O-acetyl-ADP-ribose deacetylase (regulator of RNase III)